MTPLEAPIQLGRSSDLTYLGGQTDGENDFDAEEGSGTSTPLDIPTPPVGQSPSFDYHEERKLRLQDEVYLSHSQNQKGTTHHPGSFSSVAGTGSGSGAGGPYSTSRSRSGSSPMKSFNALSPTMTMTDRSDGEGAHGGFSFTSSSTSPHIGGPSASGSGSVPAPSDIDRSLGLQHPPTSTGNGMHPSKPLYRGGKQPQESLELLEEREERELIAKSLLESEAGLDSDDKGINLDLEQTVAPNGAGGATAGETEAVGNETSGEQAVREFSELLG